MSRKVRADQADSVPRDPAEHQQLLKEELLLLANDCRSYDSGRELAHRRIAGSLRTLLHDGRGNDLVGRAGRKAGDHWLSTGLAFHPKSVFPFLRLATPSQDPFGPKYIPRCHNENAFSFIAVSKADDENLFDKKGLMQFSEWWKQVVISDLKRRTHTRRSLVLAVANKDAVHYDPELEESYRDLKGKNAVGWERKMAGNALPYPSPIPATIRQIAHEVFQSIAVEMTPKPPEPSKPINRPRSTFAPGYSNLPLEKLPALREPCFCGSGRLFKSCHGRQTSSIVAPE